MHRIEVHLEPLSSEGAPLSQMGVAIILQYMYPQYYPTHRVLHNSCCAARSDPG